jgi:hypothetical protein
MAGAFASFPTLCKKLTVTYVLLDNLFVCS